MEGGEGGLRIGNRGAVMGYAHHNLEGSGGMFPHEYLDFHIPLEQFGYIQSTKFNINTMILCTILLGLV